jgi:hypothetical protein
MTIAHRRESSNDIGRVGTGSARFDPDDDDSDDDDSARRISESASGFSYNPPGVVYTRWPLLAIKVGVFRLSDKGRQSSHEGQLFVETLCVRGHNKYPISQLRVLGAIERASLIQP